MSQCGIFVLILTPGRSEAEWRFEGTDSSISVVLEFGV